MVYMYNGILFSHEKYETLSSATTWIWKALKVLVAQSCPTLWDPMDSHQAPLSMRFSRHGYWNGLPFPSSGDLSDPGLKPRSPALQADSLPTEVPGRPWRVLH